MNYVTFTLAIEMIGESQCRIIPHARYECDGSLLIINQEPTGIQFVFNMDRVVAFSAQPEEMEEEE